MKNFYYLHLLLSSQENANEGEQALKLLREVIPNYDKRVEEDRKKGEVRRAKRPGALAKNGANQHTSRGFDNIKPSNLKLGGTSKSYILARLARDGHNDLIKSYEQGKISARQAGIQAGFIKPPKSKPLNIEALPDDVALGYVRQILHEKSNIPKLELIQELYLNLSSSEVAVFGQWLKTRAKKKTGSRHDLE